MAVRRDSGSAIVVGDVDGGVVDDENRPLGGGWVCWLRMEEEEEEEEETKADGRVVL